MEEERKEKRAAQRAAIEGFKQILDEASEVYGRLHYFAGVAFIIEILWTADC